MPDPKKLNRDLSSFEKLPRDFTKFVDVRRRFPKSSIPTCWFSKKSRTARINFYWHQQLLAKTSKVCQDCTHACTTFFQKTRDPDSSEKVWVSFVKEWLSIVWFSCRLLRRRKIRHISWPGLSKKWPLFLRDSWNFRKQQQTPAQKFIGRNGIFPDFIKKRRFPPLHLYWVAQVERFFVIFRKIPKLRSFSFGIYARIPIKFSNVVIWSRSQGLKCVPTMLPCLHIAKIPECTSDDDRKRWATCEKVEMPSIRKGGLFGASNFNFSFIVQDSISSDSNVFWSPDRSIIILLASLARVVNLM
jgi:hypothetical protein